MSFLSGSLTTSGVAATDPLCQDAGMSKCAFCIRRATLNGEHIFSNWMNRLFGPGTNSIVFRQNDENKNVVRKWTADMLNLKTRVVCPDCNSGWMSRLEEHHAKPALQDMIRHGSAVSLLPRGIASIAAFAFKSAVISDHMHREGRPFFTNEARKRFMMSLSIPSGVQMWLASLDPAKPRSGLVKSRYPHIPFYAFTYGVGHFLVQVVATKYHRSRFQSHMDQPTFTQPDVWNDFSVPFWPSSGDPVAWPPRKHVTNDLVDAFVDRWRNLNLPNWFFRL